MSMVACLTCKSVVWAYDHETTPVSGLMNLMRMPCGNCGAVGNFDGWNHPSPGWAGMHEIAEREGLTWRADGNNKWFGDATGTVSSLVRAQWSQQRAREDIEEAADIHVREEGL